MLRHERVPAAGSRRAPRAATALSQNGNGHPRTHARAHARACAFACLRASKYACTHASTQSLAYGVASCTTHQLPRWAHM
eukprot:9803591-Lingulodinium_polyedra.AAC.1